MYTDLVLDIDLYNCPRPQLMFDVRHKMSVILLAYQSQLSNRFGDEYRFEIECSVSLAPLCFKGLLKSVVIGKNLFNVCPIIKSRLGDLLSKTHFCTKNNLPCVMT